MDLSIVLSLTEFISFISTLTLGIFVLVGVTISVTLVTHAIIKYHLMDIKIAINKGLVYSALTATLTGIYFSIVFILGKVLHESKIMKGSFLLPLAALTVMALVFEPLRAKIQFMVDTRFFKTTYNYQEILKAFGESVITILDLDELVNYTTKMLTEAMKIKGASLIILDEEKGGYTRAFRETHLRKSQVTLPIVSKNQLIGLLNLGEKLSGDMYTKAELNLFEILTFQLAIAIENAKLYRLALANRVTRLSRPYLEEHFRWSDGSL